MSVVCKTVYLDKNGKESSVYENNLHLGHEAALTAYLESMKDYAFTKFQKNYGDIDKFISDAKNYKVSGVDDELYIDTRTGKTVDRVTHALSTIMPNSDDEFFMQRLKAGVIRAKAYSMVKNDPKKYYVKPADARNDKFFIEEDGPIWKEAEEYYEMPENVSTYKSRLDEAIRMNDFKREGGTEAHDVADAYVIERNKLEPDEDGVINYDLAVDAALVGVDDKLEYTKLLTDVEKFLKKVEGRGKVRFVSELTVFDEGLNVGGSIDLLAVTENGDIELFDYKTKEVGTEYKFDAQYGNLKGAMKDLPNSRGSAGAVQLSVYRLILERAGFNVKESTILYVEGKSEDIGGKLRYTNFKHKKDIPLPYHRSILVDFFADRGVTVDKPREIIEGSINNSQEFMVSLHGGLHQSTVDNKDKAIKILQKVEEDFTEITDDTKMSFFNATTGRPEYLKGSKAKKLKQIESYLNQRSDNANALSFQILDFYNGGKEAYLMGGKKAKLSQVEYKDLLEKQANNVLSGLHPKTHTLQQINSIKGYEYVDPGYMIAIDKIDGTATFINLSSEPNRKHKFEGDNENNTTMFGYHMGDVTVQRGLHDVKGKKDFSMRGWDSETQNYAIVEMGLISAELLKSGTISNVYNYRSAVITGRESNPEPKVVGITEVFNQLKLAAKVTEDTHSPYYKELFKDTDVMTVNKQKHDVIKKLIFNLETGFEDIQHREDIVPGLIKALKERSNGIMNDADVVERLFTASDAMMSSLSKRTKFKTVEDIAQHEDAKLLARAVLQIKGIDMEAGTMREINVDNMFRRSGSIMNPAIQALDSINKNNKQRIAREYDVFKSKHKKVAEALLKDYGSNIGNKLVSGDLAKAFEELFKVNPNLKITGKADDELFTLKDPSTPGLSKAQIDYINFFNESIKLGFNHLLGDSTKFKRAFDPVKGKKASYPTGRIPLQGATHENTMQRAKTFQDKMAGLLKKLNRNEVNLGEDYSELNAHLRDSYSNQMGNEFQGSPERRFKLGLSADGDVVTDPHNLETNLETILDNFMVDNFMNKSYTETLGVYNALNVISYVENNEHFHKDTGLHNYFDGYMKYIVFNQHEGDKDSTMNKVAQKTHKLISLSALGFSTAQMLLEATTNSLASMSALTQQLMLNAVGSDIRFTAPDFMKAAAMVTASSLNPMDNKVRAIIKAWGLHKLDPETLASKEFQESKKYNMFQSKWAYWLNNIPYKNVKAQIFVAQLIHLGIIDSIGVDADGVMTYDATLDERFKGIFDRNGDVYENIEDADLQVKRSKYEFLLQQLATEGGIDENGKPVGPLPNSEIKSLQDYSLTLFGSMDKDSHMLIQKTLLGQLILKFKAWIPTKIQNYYTPSHESLIRSEEVWVVDPSHRNGGYYERQAMMSEGIIQTLGGIGKGLIDIYKVDGFSDGDFIGEFANLDRVQKENLAKITADMLLLTTLMIMSIALTSEDDDDESKTEMDQLFIKILTNSTADLNMILLTRGLVDNSPIAAASFVIRAYDNLKKSAAYLYTGDGNSALRNTAKMFGATKFPLAYYDDSIKNK